MYNVYNGVAPKDKKVVFLMEGQEFKAEVRRLKMQINNRTHSEGINGFMELFFEKNETFEKYQNENKLQERMLLQFKYSYKFEFFHDNDFKNKFAELLEGSVENGTKTNKINVPYIPYDTTVKAMYQGRYNFYSIAESDIIFDLKENLIKVEYYLKDQFTGRTFGDFSDIDLKVY